MEHFHDDRMDKIIKEKEKMDKEKINGENQRFGRCLISSPGLHRFHCLFLPEKKLGSTIWLLQRFLPSSLHSALSRGPVVT
jgi:hypothetical protein